jgi:hypothetical protein
MRAKTIPPFDADEQDPSPHPAEGRLDRSAGEAWRNAVAVVAISHVAYLALAWAASYFFGPAEGAPPDGFVDLWNRWDTEHYVDIAEHGYDSPQTHEFGEAFFPFYPLAIRAFATIGFNPVFAGMMVSAIASVVALAYLYRLAEEDVGFGAGRRAMLYLAFFPTAVFLTGAYSEALFLAGAIPAFFYARRGRWSHVGLPAALAMGTRVAGVFLLLGLALEFVLQRDFDRKKIRDAFVSGTIALLPLLGYMAYLWAANDDPFYFFTAQREGWDRSLTNPVDSFLATWRTFYAEYPANWLIAWRIEVAAAIAGLFFIGWAAKRRAFGYAVYMGTLMLPLLLSSWYLSIPRMLLSMFPIAILLASVTEDRTKHELVLATSAVFAALGVVVFTEGQWFF